MVTNIVNSPNTRGLIAKQNHHNGGKLPQKIAILYTDAKREYCSTDEEFQTIDGSYEEAKLFDPYFKKLGVETCYIQADIHMTARLRKEKPDMALNLVTTVKGYDYLGATVPGTLELLEIPYTGTNILGFSLGCNKYLMHALLSQHGIPVPNFQLMTSKNTPLDPTLQFPLILKLNEEHSNIEIKKESVVENEDQLRRRLRYLLKTYQQDVLVSEFIDGREFAAFLFHSYNRKVYAVERVISLPGNPKHQFMDWTLVWDTTGKEYADRLKKVKYHDPILDAFVKKAFKVMRMDDYGKFDIRMDHKGNYYFIDANANCHFAPPESECDCEISHVMPMYGVPFKILLKRLLQNTMREWGY
jgi:D-alanine-D-alanine ligase